MVHWYVCVHSTHVPVCKHTYQCTINNYVNECGLQSTFQVKVTWLHIQRTALRSVLHLEVLWDIIDVDSLGQCSNNINNTEKVATVSYTEIIRGSCLATVAMQHRALYDLQLSNGGMHPSSLIEAHCI